MAEAAQARVQAAVEEAVQGLERDRIRGMQGAMFRCSARCCEDGGATAQQVQRCLERCHQPLARAQALVTAELQHFQDRLSRCALRCQDEARDALESGGPGGGTTPGGGPGGQLDACLAACGDTHVRLVPAMARRLRDGLAEIPQ